MDKKQLKKTLRIIHKQFISGAKFLQKQVANKDGYELKMQHAHWFMMIGTQHSGKTSLLKQSELSFIFSRKNPEATKTYEHNWWVTKNAVILDTPSSYLSSKNLKIWRHFVRLARRFSFQKKLDGILVVLSLAELQENKHHKALIKTLTQRLQTVRNTFKQRIPVYFFINKIDQLEHFNDFFAHFNRPERQQPWGLYFKAEKNITRQTQQGFKDLCQRLRSQFMSSLNQKDNITAENSRQFLEEFTELSPSIQHFMNLANKRLQKYYFLEALFFTAAFPESKNTMLSLKALSTPYTERTYAYFIHEALEHITQSTSKARRIHNRQRMSAGITLCLVILLAAIFSLAYEVGNREQRLELAAEQLGQAQKMNKPDNMQTLKAMSQAENTLNQGPHIGASDTIDTVLSQSMESSLQQNVLPALYQTVDQTLQVANLSNVDRYQIISACESLTGNNPDPESLKQLILTLSELTPTPTVLSNPNMIDTLINAIKNHVVTLSFDTKNFKETRDKLRHLSKPELAYVILANDPRFNTKLTVNFSQNPYTKGLFTYGQGRFSLPSLYIAESAKTLLKPGFLTTFIDQAQNGNATLGKLKADGNNQTVESAIKALYVERYNQVWLSFINNIQLVSPTNLQDCLNDIQHLSSTPSALNMLLELLVKNLPDEMPVDNNLLKLKQFYDGELFETLNQGLSTLNQALNASGDTSDLPTLALHFTQKRFYNTNSQDSLSQLNDLSNALPAPVKSWIQPLLSATWQNLMSESNTALKTQWQTVIYPFYQQSIQNSFPFDTQANNTVSEEAFEHFFSPNGLMAQFIQQDLGPFIQKSSSGWTMKSRDDASINLNQDTLQALESATKISTEYFNQNTGQSFFRFALQPTSEDGNIRSIQLQLGGQIVNFNGQNAARKQYVSWPDTNNSQHASLGFLASDNKQYRSDADGFWALFKIMNTGSFKQIDAHSWLVSFNQDNPNVPSLSLTLYFKGKKNLFNLDNFSSFALSQDIFTTN